MVLVFFFFTPSRYLEQSGLARVLPEALRRYCSSEFLSSLSRERASSRTRSLSVEREAQEGESPPEIPAEVGDSL